MGIWVLLVRTVVDKKKGSVEFLGDEGLPCKDEDQIAVPLMLFGEEGTHFCAKTLLSGKEEQVKNDKQRQERDPFMLNFGIHGICSILICRAMLSSREY